MVRRAGWSLLRGTSLLGFDAVLESLGWVPARQVGPSPLVGADAERIYSVLHFTQAYDPRCQNYFAAPTDPRYVQIGLKCEGNVLDMTDWLRVNGFPTLEPEHVKADAFWEQQAGVYREMALCRRAVGARTDLSAAKSFLAKVACDPIEKLPENYAGFPDQVAAGIRQP